jgi:hypothetical protein
VREGRGFWIGLARREDDETMAGIPPVVVMNHDKSDYDGGLIV